ncbi:MAG TPA: 16S rRNA (cytosine(967)-C(5))-methyltransferase RsmB [Conexibacter sp.]|jgi:16S rRNA (cytosine967-C5)-methyltransferase|nr:16S rRNA (cytosine(967)-C(5))-methyltransferase RsmB [Conexibacter sp.]
MATRTASAVSPARRVAAAVLRRVEREGAYADRALAAEATRANLDSRERAFATQLAYGAVQRRRTLDHVIVACAGRPVEQLDQPVRDALRLGVLQLLFLDGVASHAAVDQSVELAKAAGGPAFKLVNAVLRRAGRDGPALLAALGDATPHEAAVLQSVPDWIAKLWWEALGPEDTRTLLASVNEPAESALRINTLVADPVAVRAELAERGVETDQAPVVLGVGEIPEGIVVKGAFDPSTDPLWNAGALVAQSRAAMSAARLLAPQPGMRVLDLCAAPGGKATHLAALVGAGGEVVAVERNPRRAAELRRTCDRLRAKHVRIETGDAADPRADAPFDAVLVDPPCSGLGTLQGRPDLRWRARPDGIGELADLQLRFLASGAAALAPGGALVYATCTISPQENEQVVQRFLSDHPDYALDGRMLELLPHRDHTDGFFLARLRRTA